jgi:Domain of unknown function (DUF4157)
MKQTRATEHRKPKRETAPSDHLTAISSFGEEEGAAPSNHRFDALSIFADSNSSAQQSAPSQGVTALQAEFANSAHRPESFGFDFQASSGGQTLEPTVQAKMEQSFGQDFSNVKIHQDGQADRLGAHAFTVGDDIYFSGSAYNPQDSAGQRLLGHELTHVVQQREDRVHAPDSGGSATVYQDAGLEQEADRMGADAAAGLTVASRSSSSASTSKNAIQQKPVAQPAIPAAFAGLAAWASENGAAMALTLKTHADAIGAAGTLAGGAASVAGGVAPGQSGVQEVQIPAWMSDLSSRTLQFIIQAKLVNAYVDAWVRAHPGVDVAANTPEPTSTTTTTSTTTPNPAGGSSTTSTATTTRDGSAGASGGSVDTVLGESVKAQVLMDIEIALNNNQKTVTSPEFIWSDSGESTADWIGTVGAIQFVQVMSTFLSEPIALNANASRIPGLALPLQGSTQTVKMFRGGRMQRGPSMSIGYGDNLSINLVGGAPTPSPLGTLTFATSWNWDGRSSFMDVTIAVGDDGTPTFTEARRGEPDDNSWY